MMPNATQSQRAPRAALTMACAVVALSVLAGAAAAAAHGIDGARAPLAQPVEDALQAARAQALQRFPLTMRERLSAVPVRARPVMDMPDQAPLAYRLLGRGAHAVYSNGQQSVIVFDAGLGRSPGWSEDLTDPDQREALDAFLRAMAPALGLPADDVDALWRALAQRVAAWSPAPDAALADQPIGSAVVLDALVRNGPARAMDRVPGLDGLIVHELAHAMQIRSGGIFSTVHSSAWGQLCGWIKLSDGSLFNGYAGGGFCMENAETLIGLMLADDPAAAPRIASYYAHDPGAGFLNRYARFDAREDFAESVRWMAWWPDELVALSPERFMFINATGWCLDLSVDSPGPLWHDAATIAQRGWSDALHAGAARLIDPPPGAMGAGPLARAALLRAHADALDPARLPAPAPATRLPGDLPTEAVAMADLTRLTPRIGGVDYPLPEAHLHAMVDELVLGWLSYHEFSAGLIGFALERASVSDVEEALADLDNASSLRERCETLLMIASVPGAWAEGGRLIRDAMGGAIEMCDHASENGLAERLRMARVVLDPEQTARARHAAVERASTALRSPWPSAGRTASGSLRAAEGVDATELAAMVQRFSADPKDPRVAQRLDGIPGDTVGLVRRAELTIALLKTVRTASDLEPIRPMIERTRGELDRSPYPRLSGRLRHSLESAIIDAEAHQPAGP
jgi:hypothetical protein